MLDMPLFYRTFTYTTRELFNYAAHILAAYGYTVTTSPAQSVSGEPDWIVAAPPSDTPHNGVCLVAHLDTIIRKDGVELIFQGPVVRNGRGVLGADDRAGVYAILAIIMNSDRRPPVIFTNHEEAGGVGAKSLAHDAGFSMWLADNGVRLFVELDRANAKDYVYYSYECPEAVAEWVESFGFEESSGSYSDVADLTERTRVPHVNLSIGYRQQHGKSEWLSVPDMLWTISKVWSMLYTPDVPAIIMSDEQIDGPPLRLGRYSWSGSFGSFGSYDSVDTYGSYVLGLPEDDTDFGTFASCFSCSDDAMCHNEWFVCKPCWCREVLGEEEEEDDDADADEVVWDTRRDAYVRKSEAVPGEYIRLSGV